MDQCSFGENLKVRLDKSRTAAYNIYYTYAEVPNIYIALTLVNEKFNNRH